MFCGPQLRNKVILSYLMLQNTRQKLKGLIQDKLAIIQDIEVSLGEAYKLGIIQGMDAFKQGIIQGKPASTNLPHLFCIHT